MILKIQKSYAILWKKELTQLRQYDSKVNIPVQMSTKKSLFNSIFSWFCPIRVYIESYHRFHFRTVFLTQANDYFCVTWIMNIHGTAQHITQHIIRMLKKCRCVSHEWIILSISFWLLWSPKTYVRPDQRKLDISSFFLSAYCLQLIKRNTIDFDTFTETPLVGISKNETGFLFVQPTEVEKKRLKVCLMVLKKLNSNRNHRYGISFPCLGFS